MANPDDRTRIDVFLDDETDPVVSYRPPVRFELDTSQLEDGPHLMRVEGYDASGRKGVRTIPFTVRNGPGIAVDGLGDHDVLEGRVPILLNAYGGGDTDWEPSRAETPAPIPTWTWVLVIVFVAFTAFYGIRQWNPPTTLAASASDAVVRADAPANGADAAPPAEEAAVAPPTDPELGASVYGSMCASCHGADGEGMPGVFPPLAGDPVVLAEDGGEHVDVVLHGLSGKDIEGVSYASPMPGFASQLSDEEVAAVVNHERSAWGNDAPLVAPEEVAARR